MGENPREFLGTGPKGKKTRSFGSNRGACKRTRHRGQAGKKDEGEINPDVKVKMGGQRRGIPADTEERKIQSRGVVGP